MVKIANQIKTTQDKDGMLRRALERIIQLYTDKSHFIYELLQNAEDCKATKIKFIQYDNRLEVVHDGKPFTKTNLFGLCDIGKSDKIDDLNQIGEFGVGFKSVFGICDVVRLYSNPDNYQGKISPETEKFAVQINDFTNPDDIEFVDIEEPYTTRFVFPYTVGRTFSGFNSITDLNNKISQKLSDLGITTLLFMKNLELIEYEIKTQAIQDSGQYALKKHKINNHCSLVSSLIDKDEDAEHVSELSFLKFTRIIDNKSSRSVDIAFPVRIDADGKYNFEKSKDPYVSVYFPTETESKLDFIVQGPFRTTPNRSSIPAEDKDNIFLAMETGKLLAEVIVELRDMGILNMSFLKILPYDTLRFSSFNLFRPLQEATKRVLEIEDVIPCRDGGYTSKEFARIARQERLTSVFSDDMLSQLIGDGNDYHWLPPVLTETNREYEAVYRFFLGAPMRIPVIRPEDMRIYFANNPDFLPNRTDDWLVELYSVFENVPNAFSKSKNETNMLVSPFVKTKKGTFVAPYRRTENKQYVPNVFIHSAKLYSDDINFVDPSIYERCKSFFDDILGLTVPDEYEFFVSEFKKRYITQKTFDKEIHIKDIKKLIKYYKYEDYHDEISSLIRDYLYLLCDDATLRNPKSSRVFVVETTNGIKIREYYKNIGKNVSFIDQDFYYGAGINESDLLVLGVKNSLLVSTDIVDGIYDTGTRGRQPSWSASGGLRWKMSIDLLKEALLYIQKHSTAQDSLFKSQAIIKELLQNDDKLSGDIIISGSTPNLNNETCEAIKILRGERFRDWSGRWLYTDSMELVGPRNISKHDIPTAIYGTIKPDSVLFDLLGFKKTEADEADDIKKHISKAQLDAVFESELKERFGITSADLVVQFGSSNTQAVIETEEVYPFPVVPVKSWESLNKHAEEMLIYANPVKYEKVLRRMRVSNHSKESRAYLLGMYRYDGTHRYACQMCHDSTANIEAVEIFNKPDTELDPLNLCLCPNCAAFYRKFRDDEDVMRSFSQSILSKKEDEISNTECIIIPLDNQEIWFTQSHLAEIRALMLLKNKVKENKDKPQEEIVDKEVEKSGFSVYDSYIGKRITRNRDGMSGIITAIDGETVVVAVDEGNKAGSEIQISIEYLNSARGIYDIED